MISFNPIINLINNEDTLENKNLINVRNEIN